MTNGHEKARRSKARASSVPRHPHADVAKNFGVVEASVGDAIGVLQPQMPLDGGDFESATRSVRARAAPQCKQSSTYVTRPSLYLDDP